MTDILQKLRESEKKTFVGMAGPGAGKSYTFKQIVKSDEYKGKQILVLSFINKLVDDLTNDFKDFDNVSVFTLHSFARKVLGDMDVDPNLDKIIGEDYFYLIGSKINFEELFYDYKISKDVGDFYKDRKAYYKHDKSLYSLTSIIYAAVKYFEEKDKNIPDKYDLILIDEFQDFNKLECELIKLLNKKSKVILVGDDNQSLYSFKKAEPHQIRELYKASHTEEFSLDYCRRCTKVIVQATNNLIKNAKAKGLLKDSLDKKFLYPEGDNVEKDKLSSEFSKINFIPSVQGDLLFSKLAQEIKNDIKGKVNKRILILIPKYFKQTLYDGLIKYGFNIVDFELFANESSNDLKHKYLIDVFDILTKRKTDNLALRKILKLYLEEEKIKEIVVASKNGSKKIWAILSDDIKEKIEKDLEIFKKARTGKNSLSAKELLRFAELFTLKNLLYRMMRGFQPVQKGSIEVEMTTTMSSKGLSADYVYYVGIDDKIIKDKTTGKFTDHNICEFLVGITRAKEKLTLVSLEDQNPEILKFVDGKLINRIG